MMSITKTSQNGKCKPLTEDSLEGMAGAMEQWILSAAEQGPGLHEFESAWHETVYRFANLGTGLFILQQGDGDLGEPTLRRHFRLSHPSPSPPLRLTF
jgi:hypothetical protein